jgi:hypothetical protein
MGSSIFLIVAVEVGIPVNSSVSKNTEAVPKIFNDPGLGDNFTLQSVVGYSTLFGGGLQSEIWLHCRRSRAQKDIYS